jgi:dTDP-4-dehydrorhamnose reductase
LYVLPGCLASTAKNFIKTMLNLGETHDTITVVNDQIGTPTYTYDLAQTAGGYAGKDRNTASIMPPTRGDISPGTILRKEIFRQAGMEVNVVPVTSEEYKAKAKRPFNSRMEKEEADGTRISPSSLTGGTRCHII